MLLADQRRLFTGNLPSLLESICQKLSIASYKVIMSLLLSFLVKKITTSPPETLLFSIWFSRPVHMHCLAPDPPNPGRRSPFNSVKRGRSRNKSTSPKRSERSRSRTSEGGGPAKAIKDWFRSVDAKTIGVVANCFRSNEYI